MNAPFFFSIHDLVRGRLEGEHWLLAPAVHELKFYESQETLDNSALDLQINFTYDRGKNRSQKGGSSLCWSGHHRLARWQIIARRELTSDQKSGEREQGSNSILLLDFQGNLASHFIIAKWVAEPAIRLLAEEKGALFTHAGGITDGEKAVLLAGEGGAGKTTWVLHWLSAGHGYLSDDFSLLKENRLFPYLTPLRLSAANLLLNPVLAAAPVGDKLQIISRTILRRLVFGYARFSFKTTITRFLPEIKIYPPTPLAAAIWLTRRNTVLKDKTPYPLGRVSAETMAQIMTETDRAEMHGFETALLSGPLPGFCSSPSEFWTRHQKTLLAALHALPCFIVRHQPLPPTSALSSVSALLSWLEKQ